MSTPYDNCFDHITDPVQRNSVRQQWLQMLDGGLSVADVRMLLDKYPDFRLAISHLIRRQPSSFGFSYDTMDRLKEFVATLPEFKDVFDKYVSNLVSAPGNEKQSELNEKKSKLNKLATIFPEFKQVAEKYIEAIRKYEKEQREAAERERLEREPRESAEERRERERKEYEYLFPDSDRYSEHRTHYYYT